MAQIRSLQLVFRPNRKSILNLTRTLECCSSLRTAAFSAVSQQNLDLASCANANKTFEAQVRSLQTYAPSFSNFDIPTNKTRSQNYHSKYEDESDMHDFDDRESYSRGHGQDSFSPRGFQDNLGAKLKDRDWSKVKLDSLLKDVFKPTGASSQRSTKEVDAFKESNRITIVHGDNIPNPIVQFEEAGFSAGIVKKLKDSGFESPMPIQAQGWPIALSGRDLIGIGETGSGKTLGKICWHSCSLLPPPPLPKAASCLNT